MFTHVPRGMSRESGHPHQTVAEAKACEAEAYEYELQAQAERAAERAVERYFEEGLHGSSYAGSEEEARDRFYESLLGL